MRKRLPCAKSLFLLCELCGCRFIPHPQQRAIARADKLARVNVRLIAAFEHASKRVRFIRSRSDECYITRVVDERSRERDSIGVELRDVVGDNYAIIDV